MRILFLSPNQINRYNRGHQLFRNTLSQFAEVDYVGPGFDIDKQNITPILLSLTQRPDVIATYGLKYTIPFTGLADISIPKVHFVCDYLTPKPGFEKAYSASYNKLLERDNYDMLFVRNTRLVKHFTENGWKKDRIKFLPFSANIQTFFPDPEKERDIDLSVCWSNLINVYPKRPGLTEKAKSLSEDYNVFVGRPHLDAYVDTLQRSKVNLNSFSQWPGVNMRVFEAMACGSVCLTDKTIDLGTAVNLIDGREFVAYNTEEEFLEKFNFLMARPALCNQIANQAVRTVQNYHSDEVRAEQAVCAIKEMLRG